jgi:thiamine-monophosphate kinase
MKPRLPREDLWIERWTQALRPHRLPGLRHGLGHDCAVLASPSKKLDLVLKTDAVVEGVHFLRSTPAALAGRKALARALSDLAAAGATPRAALLTAGCPDKKSAARLHSIYRGLAQAARRWRVAVVGGETVRTRQLLLSVSLLGTVSHGSSPHRGGARPGDLLFVTGTLGGSWPRRHLTFTPRLPEGQWLARKKIPSATIDLSDGLGADLPRLARMSKVGFQIHPAKLPLARGATAHQASSQGEDYELLFAVPKSKAVQLRKTWPFSTRLTEIGVCLPSRYGFHTGGLPLQGYDHLR